jgi:large subunit ribosomal protein L32e
MDHLELKRIMNKKRPEFRATDVHKKKRINRGWRKPRGMHAKIRLAKKGYGKEVSIGYRSPADVRGMNRKGKKLVNVSRPEDVKALGEDCAIIITSSVGTKKRLLIIKEAFAKNITIMGLKDPQAFIAKVDAEMLKKKEVRSKKVEEKDKKQKAKEEKAKEKEQKDKAEKSDAAPETMAEKKQEEKKEMDKLLTTKE